jgi:hypothetical protein
MENPEYHIYKLLIPSWSVVDPRLAIGTAAGSG